MTTRPFRTDRGIILPRSVSFSARAALQSQEGEEEVPLRTRARREHRDISGSFRVEGPCGKILDTMPIPVKAGQYDWPFLRPAAFVQLLARENPRFGDMLKAVGPRLRLAFYLDEIKPGNILRPDAGRTLCNFYWCFLDLPSWFRARDSGWMLFGCFPYKLVKGVRGGYSFLFGEMLKQFFDNDPLLDSRSGFPCTCAEGLFLCLGDFTMLVSDEKALKEVLMLRGASGTKPCLFCQNVLGHMPAESVENDEYLVHYTNPDRTRFRCHTSESFDLQLQRLHRARDSPIYFLPANQVAWQGKLLLLKSPPRILRDPQSDVHGQGVVRRKAGNSFDRPMLSLWGKARHASLEPFDPLWHMMQPMHLRSSALSIDASEQSSVAINQGGELAGLLRCTWPLENVYHLAKEHQAFAICRKNPSGLQGSFHQHLEDGNHRQDFASERFHHRSRIHASALCKEVRGQLTPAFRKKTCSGQRHPSSPG